MESSKAGTMPTVLLSCFSSAKRSILVTESFARDYEKLIHLAYHRYGEDYPRVAHDVHFHHKSEHIIDDQYCEAESDDLLFDLGEYFNEPFMQQGKLRLFAHFVAKVPPPVEQKIKSTKSAAHDRAEPRFFKKFEYEKIIDEEDRAEPQLRKRRTQYAPRPSLADATYEDTSPTREQAIHQARKRRAQELDLNITSEERLWQRARVMSTASQYPPMPTSATAQKFLQELEAIVNNGPPLNSMHNKRKVQINNVKERRIIAHALMIETEEYGVDSIEPCSACVANGNHCRVYHPDMQKYPWRAGLGKNLNRGVGTSCAMCRSHVRRGCDAA